MVCSATFLWRVIGLPSSLVILVLWILIDEQLFVCLRQHKFHINLSSELINPFGCIIRHMNEACKIWYAVFGIDYEEHGKSAG